MTHTHTHTNTVVVPSSPTRTSAEKNNLQETRTGSYCEDNECIIKKKAIMILSLTETLSLLAVVSTNQVTCFC